MLEYVFALLLYCEAIPNKCTVIEEFNQDITLYVCDVPRDILTPKIQFRLIDELTPLGDVIVTVKIKCIEA